MMNRRRDMLSHISETDYSVLHPPVHNSRQVSRQSSCSPFRYPASECTQDITSVNSDTISRSSVLPEHHSASTSEKQPLVSSNPGLRKKVSWYDRTILWTDKWWLWETLACLVAAGCFGAIVILLFRAHGSPVEDRESGTFTLNSIVALLSTVMRVAVLVPIAAAIGQQKWLWFQLQKPGSRSYRSLEDMELLDSASRGPWGSIVLLFQRFGLHLGTLGAALVVISLAMGTFTQIIVSTQIQLVSETIPAPAWIQSFHSENGFSNRAMEFRRAFEQALLNTNETMLEMPTCPTGNCRWPVFPTLGMCGSCIDRTTEIELVCGLGSVPSKAVQTITAYCAYTLPGERVEREGSDIFGFDYNFDALPEIESFSKVKQNRTGEEIRGVRVFLVSASNTYQNNATGFNTFRIHDNTRRFSQGPTIQDCNFSWCIKAYNVSVVNGSLETEMVGDWSDFSTPPAPTIKFPQKPPSYFNLQSIPEPLVRSMEMGDTPWSVPAQIEQMPTRSVYATTRLFDQGPYLDSNLTFSEFRAMSMYKITDYQRWISNVAMSVTNAMRRTGDRPLNHAKYAGQAFTPKQFYHIRFWWLIFPGTLLILSILLLGTTIWITHEQRVEHWKNDALPLLYTTIDEDIRAQSQTPRDMADHQVVLVRTQGQSLMRKVL